MVGKCTAKEIAPQVCDHVGGFGHLLMMGQGGLLNHEETVANLKLFSKEILLRVGELAE